MPKRELKFEGEVNGWGGSLTDTSPEIGDRHVIHELEGTFGDLWRDRPNVRVLLGVEPLAEGPLQAMTGFGGTDVTPPDSPVIEVGGFDLLNKLHDLDGRTVVLVIEEAS